MSRLFVAIELPDAVRQRLVESCFGLPGARWTPISQLHLTLRFIGEVEGGLAQDVSAALGEVVAPAFRMSLRGLGHFPPRGEPRITWAGVRAGDELPQLARAVERALQRAGVAPEPRKFHPHVTLARLKDTPPRRVADWLAMEGLLESRVFAVTEFALLSSVLGSQGATHHVEATYPLVTEGADLGDELMT